jgi:hypothetical protein
MLLFRQRAKLEDKTAEACSNNDLACQNQQENNKERSECTIIICCSICRGETSVQHGIADLFINQGLVNFVQLNVALTDQTSGSQSNDATITFHRQNDPTCRSDNDQHVSAQVMEFLQLYSKNENCSPGFFCLFVCFLFLFFFFLHFPSLYSTPDRFNAHLLW